MFANNFERKTCRTLLIRHTKAIFVRLLFALHGFATIWRVTDVCEKSAFYLLCFPFGMLLFEIFVTSYYTRSGEWKWFCPSVFLYLASVIPGIWLLHLDLYQERETYRQANELPRCAPMMMFNVTGLREIRGVTLPVMLPADQWVLWLQQIMFVVLVIGRWLLPKGHLSRDQLSQLLLFYLGIAADSLEFSIDTLSIGEVFCNQTLIFVVLFIWTWSMMQFTLVRFSVTKHPQNDGKGNDLQEKSSQTNLTLFDCGSRVFSGICGNEIVSLLITVLLQDGPFLVMRIYLMLQFQVVNEMMLFFVAKNILVVGIQLYRVAVLFCCPGSHHDDDVNMFDFNEGVVLKNRRQVKSIVLNDEENYS